MLITYLIWDAGGTLFDTYPAVVEAARAALVACGAPVPSPGEVMPLFRKSVAHGLHVLAVEADLDEAAFAERFWAQYEDTDPAHQPPFPGVVEVCRFMRAQGGQNFIVTHRERPLLDVLLDAHRMAVYFTDCITQEDGYPRKPDPTSILALLARHDLDPKRGLVIGDRALDMLAARAAEVRACFLGAALIPGSESAVLTVTDYADLLSFIQEENT